MTIEEYLMKHEAERLFPYNDKDGKQWKGINITIGVGHNLTSNGISLAASLFILQEDIRAHEEELIGIFPRTWDGFSENVKKVFIDMHFHFGDPSFRKTLADAITKANSGDWPGVLQAIIDCPNGYYNRFKSRAMDNLKLLEEG